VVENNISALTKKNCFTITTGHQLNIFTGPLYFVYKILAVINITEQLKEVYPDYDFVPVYWMASEDHDFEEINHFRLFNKEYTWELDAKGAVGRLDPKSISSIFEQLPEKIELFEKAYLQNDTLADATRYFVNELFGEYGLVVLDADHNDLKKHFREVIKDDILNNTPNDLVEESNKKLESLGYKSQVFPRKINQFYLKEGLRERIVEDNDQFKVLNTDIKFSKEQITSLAENEPGVFSPNVILRPLYQEMILPNLAYIGGPAEVVYWLQLKGVFDHFKVNFPILMPRSFALVVNKGLNKKLGKLGITAEALFNGKEALKEKYVSENSEGLFDIGNEKDGLIRLFSQIRTKAVTIDKSMEGFIKAEEARSLKTFENIQKRLKKAEEQNLETGIKQITNVYDRLFPNGSLQERTDNFLNFSINDPAFIKSIKSLLDPFDFRFNIIIGNE
jgi:bacillithiol biosynthesis cysteine-adding enzyme BshC